MALMENYKPKISARNKEFSDRVRKLLNEYSIVGVIDVLGLRAPQFQKIRMLLKKNAQILIVKRNLIELVLNEFEEKFNGISELVSKASGVVGLVFTNDNPFTLYKIIQKNKSKAPAKANQIAPNDIVVPAGPTNFVPGPIIGELGAVKIKAGVSSGGKIEIKEDSLVVKEGEQISSELAGILSRLEIEPMEVGLNVKAIYEGGTIYESDILNVDSDAILEDLKFSSSESFRLSIGLNYYTKENVAYFLSDARRDSLSLGIGIAWPSDETINSLLVKASSQANAIALSLPEDIRPAGVVASAQVPVAEDSNSSANEESKKEDKEATPKVDAAAGLGGLF